MRTMHETVQTVVAVPPVNTTGAAQTGVWASLKDGARATIQIITGAWAGGTSAVTLQQATSAAGAGAKALGMTSYWLNSDHTASAVTLTKTAIVANTFNLTSANDICVIELDASDLDVTNGFCYFQVLTASPGANADYVTAVYHITQPRIQGQDMVNAQA